MNELYGGFGGAPIDDDILGMFGGMPSLTKPQAQSQALRTKRTNTSVTPSVSAQEGTTSPLRQSGVDRAQAALPEQYAALDKAMGPQDYTGMQNYAKERAQSGQKSLLLALAAQTAGKDYAPLGGAYLKRAMEAREPLKTSTGFITDTGEHIQDAQLAADQKVKQITAQIQRNEQIINSAATAEEKDRAHKENMALRVLQMQSNELLKQMTVAAAGAKGDARTAGNNDKIGARVYDDFVRNTKDQQTQINAYKNLQATAKRADAASDLSFIFQYMKMLDPGSVVRESEYATAQNARGVPDSIRNLYNSVMQGRKLTPGQREQFLGTAGNLAAEAEQRMEQVRADLIRQLPQGVDPSIYLPGARSQAAPAAAVPGVTVTRGGGAPAPQPGALPPGVTVTRGG